MTSGPTTRTASPWRRVVATAVDSAVLSVIPVVLTQQTGTNYFRGGGLLVICLAFWLILSLLQSSRWQTPGKRLLGLRVESRAGGRLAVIPSLLRNAWLLLGVIPLIGEVLETVAAVVLLVSMAWHPERYGLHDQMAEAAVVHR